MNQHLQKILNFIQQDEKLTVEEKAVLTKAANATDSDLSISEFKLDRTEKVKRTTAILLEETIEELEQKRKAVEAQNRELEIEKALEKVRSSALAMKELADMIDVCHIISDQLELLNVKEIRNVQTAIFYVDKGTYFNYEYYRLHDKSLITEVVYVTHPVSAEFADRMLNKPGELFTKSLEEAALKEWYAFQQTTNQFDDTHLATASSLNYYWYSIGPVALGISTYAPLNEEEINLFKRFRNVFELAYRRFIDIEKAIAQAKEARIETALERVRAVAMAMRKPGDLLDICETLYSELDSLGFADMRNAMINIYNDEKETCVNYDYSDEMGKSINPLHYNLHPVIEKQIRQLRSANDAFSETIFEGKDLQDWKAFRVRIGEKDDPRINNSAALYYYFYSIGIGSIGISSFNSLTGEKLEVLKRFRNVFSLSYQRYIDISLAEAQAKEAQIQLALERIRARTMAMQKSDELPETSYLLFEQFKELGLKADQMSIGIINEEEGVVELSVTLYGNQLQSSYKVPLNEPFVISKAVIAWKESKRSMVVELSGKDLEDYNAYRNKMSKIKFTIDLYGTDPRWIVNLAFFSKGWISFSTIEPTPEETIQLLERFAGVFDGTYTRFLDLKQAEAQAREAKIEAALERTRTQSMIMQHSKELDDTLLVFHEQVQLLGIHSAFSFLWLPDEEKEKHIFWAIWEENLPAGQAGNNSSKIFKNKAIRYLLNRNDPATKQCLIDWKGNEPVVSYAVPPGGVKNYFAAWQELIDGVETLRPEHFSKGLYYVEAFMKYGCFGVMMENDLNETDKKILGRFAIEFERTYTRFLDLKKAEAQAKEAQIETALEKVRSRSLAMHKSEEVIEVVKSVFERLNELNIELNTAFIIIFKEGSRDTEWWLINKDKGEYSRINVPYADLLFFRNMFEAKKEGKELLATTYHAEEKHDLFHYLFTQTDFKYAPPERQKFIFETEAVSISMGMTNKIAIQITRHNEMFFSAEENEILRRFARVFDQSYTRFLDLQKAEAQAKEAQIETALERVRSHTMAMHNSADVGETVAVLFDELRRLGIETIRCGIGIMHESKEMEIWTAKPAVDGKADMIIGYIDMSLHALLKGALNGWKKKKKSFAYELSGNDLVEYFEAINKHDAYPVQYDIASLPKKIFHHDFYFSEGTLFAFTLEQLTEETQKIFKRFAAVFGQTYRRYLDLKKAEAQAKESQIEAALERVRSRTLAMQSSNELAETAAILFKQLIQLGIAPNRLYIAIIEDKNGYTEFWITGEDGSKVSSAFHTNLNDNASFKKMLDGWKQEKKSLIIDMQGEELQDYFKYLSSINVPFKGGLAQKRRVQDIAYFNNGFIGIASPDEQPAATLQLLERFAYVFNLTFTRFNDLKLAEAHAVQAEQDLIAIKEAKQKAEAALTELQATQKQLVQSEKMASLGELTAGIAHEIQNPLNFVNNFSEVNAELISELVEEVDKGNMSEVKLLAKDIKENEEKINHHGKRADAIVKGMLQHSRSSNGIKESTDINALCDEYLRLSYHGLRAKDKSFNATLKTNLDNSIGKVNIIPQDFGRVILNLLNNAFYAVNEKNLSAVATPTAAKYEPTVSISTKKINGKIEIRVSDNGNGISAAVKEKIFQPFFTTKPTGQGTGLGLSLSYDIITKGHGGELKVETIEGEGTTFAICLNIA